MPTTVRRTGRATLTSGAVGVPGSVYRAAAPSATQTTAPMASNPWLVTCVSSSRRTTPRTIRSRPATLSGRLPKPMKARRMQIAPRIPVTKFGFCSSKMSP